MHEKKKDSVQDQKEPKCSRKLNHIITFTFIKNVWIGQGSGDGENSATVFF